MKKRYAFLWCSLIAVLSLSPLSAQVTGFDQVGTTSMQFLTVIPNARAAAMGGVATTSINNSEAVFFNPAMLTRAKPGINFGYLDYFLDIGISSLSASWQMGSIGVLGFQAQVTNYGDIVETRVDQLVRDDATGVYNLGLTGGTITPSSLVLGLTFSRALTDRFAFGLTTKLAREDLVVKAVNAVVFDGGMIYRTGLRSLELGTMLRNFGAEVQYFDEGYSLPQIFSVGVSGLLIGPDGETFVSSSESSRLLFAYDLTQTRDHSQQQHLGAEYSFNNLIILRSGYKLNFDEESWTAGFGLNYNRFQVDYSYNDFGEFLSGVQRFSLNVQIK